ncbi:MAG: YceI family protein, partial [Gemmatimonadota bacterium]
TGKTVWEIDAAHTEVGFSVRHMMITTVRGRFGGVSGRIELDAERPERSSVEVTIDAASISTGTPDRDTHLRSADFLDVETYPELTYRSRAVESTGEGAWRVTGDLTMHGVTREVVLEALQEGHARDPWGGRRASFSATTKIDRRDFGLTWNAAMETGGVLVGNEVRISLEVQAVQAEA